MVRRIARLALDAALVTVVVFAVFIAYGVIGNRWYRIVAVAGGSMEPGIPVGSLIVITPPSDPLSVGSVITFIGDGRLVTHRIVDIRSNGFPVTQGDANNSPDTFTSVTVVGRVEFSIPWLGFVIPGASADAAFRASRIASATLHVGPWVDPAPVATAAPGLEPSLELPPLEPPPGEPPSPETPVEPTPSATPAAPPEPIPEPTPEPSVEPAPEIAPEPTPEPTSSSSPQPELSSPPTEPTAGAFAAP